jgi:hypothetical protein
MTTRLITGALAAVGLIMLASTPSAHAGDPQVKPPKKGTVYIYGGAARASRYYNLNGDLKRYDTLGTDFSATTFGLSANYGLIENLELNLDVPIGYYNLTSKSRFPDRSILSPSYYGIGATYQISDGKLNSSVSTMLKIPPGFHKGIYDDPAHPTFLSDGYLQLTTTLNFGFNLKETWFKGSAGYNWRDEEPLDEIVYNAELGMSKVEGTGIFVGCSGVVSTGDVTQPLMPFYTGASGNAEEQTRGDGGQGIFRTIDRENYFAINAGAFVSITEHISISGKYAVRLFGKNSLSLQGAYLGVGYSF